MKQVLVRGGQAAVEEVPAPLVEAGTVLVRVACSCISPGTELSGLRASGVPLWKRALRDPTAVRRTLGLMASQGLRRTRSVVQGALSAGAPTGYSAAGTVLEVGAGIDDLRPGDLVACAGAQCAHHAEVIRVPRHLAAPVPEGLDLAAASTVTLGAIALQGVRRAAPTLGETFVVLGLGALGQLTAQLLRANGCRAVGADLDPDRLRLAAELGMDAGVHPDDGDPVGRVLRLTGGVGADGVLITAAGASHEVVSTAFRMCRRKGRVVLVGDVGLHLRRADFYQKEIDFLVSCSYGPGRYDPAYEEGGQDYPVGYVRWTENRNMGEVLRLMASGAVRIEPLVSATYEVDHAAEAYRSFAAAAPRPLMVLLSYPGQVSPSPRRVPNPRAATAREGAVRVAVVGAGGFARGMHLPNLGKLGGLCALQAVVSRTGHNAAAAAKQFGARYAATDYAEVLADPEVDAVLLATRHNLHATMALAALRAGKHVLLEKPLALTRGELDSIQGFYAAEPPAGAPPLLLTGFNRRFSPFAARLRELTRDRAAPMMLTYRMNAGHLPLDHWVHGEEGGGRNLGEACHVYDLFTFLTDSRAVSVKVDALAPRGGHYGHRDNFVATVAFEDGSLATLAYTSLGCGEFPKEQLEVFCDGRVLRLDDYRALTVHGAGARGLERKVPDKGHEEELRAFVRAVREGGEWPIPLWQQVQATEIALRVEEGLVGR